MTVVDHTRLLPFQNNDQNNDLDVLVAFWNRAFSGRRNFYPLTTQDFQERVLDCEAFDADGLILAWHTDRDQTTTLVGMVHAFRPPPRHGLYLRTQPRHELALLYVEPAHRRQGIGSRLLRAAENWLYYCPVYVGGSTQSCYGTIEGPRPPFFGSSQRMGISVHDSTLINFLAKRGYHVVEAGDVSMRLTLTPRSLPILPLPVLPKLEALGLRLLPISHEMPFHGREPEGRAEYTFYGDNHGAPYFGYLLVKADDLLQAHISWYPMRQAGSAAIAGFWVAPALRGRGLGRYLLDRTLYDLHHAPRPWGGYDQVEAQTHLTRHALAAALYERRGFEIDAAWVNMSKECAVRGVKPPAASEPGMSGY